MTCEEFQVKLRECRTEIEVRRLMLYWADCIVGTRQEIEEALVAADARAMELAEDRVALGKC